MQQFRLVFLAIICCAACNLTTIAPTEIPTPTPIEQELPPTGSSLIATVTVTNRDLQPTSLPLPGLPATSPPVTSVPALNNFCDVYTTYSGTRIDNKLSLRDAPSVSAVQIFRVPNRVQVLRVPGSQEIEAEGYHWLNVIYVDSPQMRIEGWIARDSFEIGGERDPSVATLQAEGTQAAC